MILTLVDTMSNTRVPLAQGAVTTNQMFNGQPSVSFKNVVNTLINRVEGETAQGKTAPLDELVTQLSKVLQTLENIDLENDPAFQIEAAVDKIASALVDFAAATGIDLVGEISPVYANPAESLAVEITVQADEESPVTDTSGLITFINLITQLSDVVEGSSDIPSDLKRQLGLDTVFTGQGGQNLKAVSPAVDKVAFDQIPPSTKSIQLGLDGAVIEQPRLAQQIAQVTQPGIEVVEAAKSAAQPATLTLAGLALQAENATTSAQTVAKVKIATKVSPIGESKPTVAATAASPVDLQIAMTFAQNNSEKGWSTSELFKSTFEFVSNISNGQLTLQNPALGLLPIVEPRLADLLPFDRPFWASNAPIDAASPAQSGDAPASKTSRFAAAIVDQIRTANVTDGQTRIELSPRGLGNIEIEVTTDGDGATNVVIRADNSVVLNALREMRDPWVQITGMENGAAFSFEDMSSQQDNTGGNDAGNTAEDGSANSFETGQSAEIAAAAIIEGDQLDLMT